MSHRVATKTQITDKKLAIEALKLAGWSYRESGNSLRVTSGPMNRSTINLTNGEIVGDTDWHSTEQLGALRQHYGEAKVRSEAIKTGATIESREVLSNGEVRLVLTANFG